MFDWSSCMSIKGHFTARMRINWQYLEFYIFFWWPTIYPHFQWIGHPCWGVSIGFCSGFWVHFFKIVIFFGGSHSFNSDLYVLAHCCAKHANFIIPSTLKPSEESQPTSMIVPPPCFIVPVVFVLRCVTFHRWNEWLPKMSTQTPVSQKSEVFLHRLL